MKKLVVFSALSFLFLQSCGLDGIFANKTDEPEPGTEQSDAKPLKKTDPNPHEVRKGRDAKYAYTPDTAVNKLVIGNPESFGAFWKEYGADMTTSGHNRSFTTYYNSEKTEEMVLEITRNAKAQELVYAITVQKAANPKIKQLQVEKNNFVTGNSLYLGMSPEYVQSAYIDQVLIQWEKGDTLYLQYKPREKDAKEFHRYSWKSYTATYKFVDFRLRRMEYTVDPAEFEGH